jgi:hypothetical protein
VNDVTSAAEEPSPVLCAELRGTPKSVNFGCAESVLEDVFE